MKARAYDRSGKERWLGPGTVVPAGWYGPDMVQFTREMRVDLIVVQGEDLDLPEEDSRNVRRLLRFVPNISDAEASSESKAKADAVSAAVTAVLGGRRWRGEIDVNADALMRVFGKKGSEFSAAMAEILRTASPEAEIVFGNANQFYPRITAMEPDGREGRAVLSARIEWTTREEREAKSDQAKKLTSTDDGAGDGGGSGHGRHVHHGGLDELAERGESYNKADVDWAFDARNPANQWND